MSSFKNILIPIDLSINTEMLVKKALELADGDTTIHLLFVEDNGISGLFRALKKYMTDEGKFIRKQEIKRKMDVLKIRMEESCKNIKVCNWIVVANSVQNSIRDKALQLGVDLIIISKNNNHSWFPFLNRVIPSMLVKKTGIAVLTLTAHASDNKVRNVVIPIIGNDSVQLKMDMISNLCKKFKLNIHLLTFTRGNDDNNDLNVSSFLQAYQCLKLYNNCNLEYAVLYGDNKAKAILKYAEKIQADILIVHPGSETEIGWPNKNITDMVPTASRMHVLAV